MYFENEQKILNIYDSIKKCCIIINTSYTKNLLLFILNDISGIFIKDYSDFINKINKTYEDIINSNKKYLKKNYKIGLNTSEILLNNKLNAYNNSLYELYIGDIIDLVVFETLIEKSIILNKSNLIYIINYMFSIINNLNNFLKISLSNNVDKFIKFFLCRLAHIKLKISCYIFENYSSIIIDNIYPNLYKNYIECLYSLLINSWSKLDFYIKLQIINNNIPCYIKFFIKYQNYMLKNINNFDKSIILLKNIYYNLTETVILIYSNLSKKCDITNYKNKEDKKQFIKNSRNNINMLDLANYNSDYILQYDNFNNIQLINNCLIVISDIINLLIIFKDKSEIGNNSIIFYNIYMLVSVINSKPFNKSLIFLGIDTIESILKFYLKLNEFGYFNIKNICLKDIYIDFYNLKKEFCNILEVINKAKFLYPNNNLVNIVYSKLCIEYHSNCINNTYTFFNNIYLENYNYNCVYDLIKKY